MLRGHLFLHPASSHKLTDSWCVASERSNRKPGALNEKEWGPMAHSRRRVSSAL